MSFTPHITYTSTSIKPSGTVIAIGDGNRLREWKGLAMGPQTYAKRIARQHGIVLTKSEANYILWERTPYPMMSALHPLVTRRLRMEFADLERFESWRGMRGLAARILEQAILDRQRELDGE